MRKLIPYLTGVLCIAASNVYSQPQYWEVGLKISKEFVGTTTDGASIGGTALYKISKNSAIEAGLLYKFNPKKYLNYSELGNQTKPFYEPIKEIEKTILIPISYRFESSIVNFSAGSGVHILLNKKELTFTNSTLKKDWLNNTMEVMATVGISKNLRVNKTMYVEPEIRQCYYFSGGGAGFQLNLSFKKRFD